MGDDLTQSEVGDPSQDAGASTVMYPLGPAIPTGGDRPSHAGVGAAGALRLKSTCGAPSIIWKAR